MPKRKAALDQATQTIRAVSRLGFQWEDLRGPLAKIHEELGELEKELRRLRLLTHPHRRIGKRDRERLASELGDLLFCVANVAFFLKISPERSLQGMLSRFRKRFSTVEKLVKRDYGRWTKLSLARLDFYWDEAKRLEKARR